MTNLYTKHMKTQSSGGCPALCAAVVMDPITESERAAAVQAGLRVYHIVELEGIGAAHVGESPHRPPGSSDLATFCYTSGKML
jgi:long-subunit acyl-CoA synthetase (AMP-forming)